MKENYHTTDREFGSCREYAKLEGSQKKIMKGLNL